MLTKFVDINWLSTSIGIAVMLDIVIAIVSCWLVHRTPVHRTHFVLVVAIAVKYSLFTLADLDHYVDFIAGFDIVESTQIIFCRVCGVVMTQAANPTVELVYNLVPRLVLLSALVFTLRRSGADRKNWNGTKAGIFFNEQCKK